MTGPTTPSENRIQGSGGAAATAAGGLVLGSLTAGGLALGGLALAGLTAAAITTVTVARRVVTPPQRKIEDARVLAVDEGSTTITLSASPDATVPGRYGFWFSRDTGHARLGDVLLRDEATVTRLVEEVSFGDLRRATHGRFGSWFYLRPEELGYPAESVLLPTELGEAPAWMIPAEPRRDDADKWVIQVHGRATQRQEGLRAIPLFRQAGYTSLLVSYRNDGDAPFSTDRRYALGTSEWHDVEAAIRYAVEHGARDVVLMGWSMGGAIVLQAVTRSPLAKVVRGVVLDSPVIDWVDTLEFQARMLRLPALFARAAMWLIGAPWAPFFTGQEKAIDLDRLDFVAHADELTLPMLILHSDDDGYVPSTASRALSEARPDIVTFVPFRVARHTKLWNYDPDRWTAAIAGWLAAL